METNSELLCIRRIKSVYPILTKSETSIADYVTSNPDSIANMSVYDLATAAGTSAASITRFCRKIGFKSFQEFKFSLSHEWLTPDYGIIDLSEKESVSILKQKVFLFCKRMMDDMMLTLDDDSLELAAQKICDAKHVIFIAEGGSAASARIICQAFLSLGISCECFADSYIELIRIPQLDKDTVAITLSYSGRDRNTMIAAQAAHKAGLPVIGIIGIPNTPLAKYLDIELLLNAFANNEFSSSIAARMSECAVAFVLFCLIRSHKSSPSPVSGDIEKLYELLRVDWNE